MNERSDLIIDFRKRTKAAKGTDYWSLLCEYAENYSAEENDESEKVEPVTEILEK